MKIDLDSLPLAEQVRNEALTLGVPDPQFAAEGGEDYELLVAMPRDFGAAGVREFEAACRIALTRVGTVKVGGGVRIELAGRPLALRGYDHFR